MKHIYTFLYLFLVSGVAVANVTGIAHVTDRDTIKIGDTRVRLHGIDAPEQQQECGKNGQTWRCGHASTQTLSNLIDSQVVTCKGTDTDQYERLIAVCYVNGMDLNAAMVDVGMAMAYRRYSKNYVPNELRAKENGKGLWVGNFVYPWDWRQGKVLPTDMLMLSLLNLGMAPTQVRYSQVCRMVKGPGLLQTVEGLLVNSRKGTFMARWMRRFPMDLAM